MKSGYFTGILLLTGTVYKVMFFLYLQHKVRYSWNFELELNWNNHIICSSSGSYQVKLSKSLFLWVTFLKLELTGPYLNYLIYPMWDICRAVALWLCSIVPVFNGGFFHGKFRISLIQVSSLWDSLSNQSIDKTLDNFGASFTPLCIYLYFEYSTHVNYGTGHVSWPFWFA